MHKRHWQPSWMLTPYSPTPCWTYPSSRHLKNGAHKSLYFFVVVLFSSLWDSRISFLITHPVRISSLILSVFFFSWVFPLPLFFWWKFFYGAFSNIVGHKPRLAASIIFFLVQNTKLRPLLVSVFRPRPARRRPWTLPLVGILIVVGSEPLNPTSIYTQKMKQYQ